MTALTVCSQPSCRALAPIVVGGSGGSGTRVVAEILMRAGVYLGSDLNGPHDNLTFTYVCKHPYRYAARPERISAEQADLFALHESLFFGRLPSGGPLLALFLRCARDHALRRYSPAWVFERWSKVRAAPKDHRCLWGWKEPNSMYFLDGLKLFYPQAKYIQVVRHGLDMVYTQNDQQYFHWAPRYGIDPKDERAVQRFAFWHRSNRAAVETAQALFGQNFCLIRFEDLVLSPEQSLRQLLEFVQPPAPPDLPSLAHIPRKPDTFQRYKERDLAWVGAEVRAQLADFGFSV